MAFREVADALAATYTLSREEAACQALAATSTVTLKLAKARYVGGMDNHLGYLDAQRIHDQARNPDQYETADSIG